MSNTAAELAEVTAFARAMRPDLPTVDRALGAVRALFADAGVPYLLVGGVAVIHHGYIRATVDLDLLVDAGHELALEPLLAAHGFERLTARRLRHLESGVPVDLLVAGDPMPRPGAPSYPRPQELARSPGEPDVVGLEALIALKLHAGRHQDQADVVALLGELDERAYLDLEVACPAPLRGRLWELRRDALEEAAWKKPVPPVDQGG